MQECFCRIVTALSSASLVPRLRCPHEFAVSIEVVFRCRVLIVCVAGGRSCAGCRCSTSRPRRTFRRRRGSTALRVAGRRGRVRRRRQRGIVRTASSLDPWVQVSASGRVVRPCKVIVRPSNILDAEWFQHLTVPMLSPSITKCLIYFLCRCHYQSHFHYRCHFQSLTIKK